MSYVYYGEAWSRCAKPRPKKSAQRVRVGLFCGLFRTFSCGREVKFSRTHNLYTTTQAPSPAAPRTRSVFSAKERRPDEAGGLGDCGQDASCHQGRHGLLRLLLRTLRQRIKPMRLTRFSERAPTMRIHAMLNLRIPKMSDPAHSPGLIHMAPQKIVESIELIRLLSSRASYTQKLEPSSRMRLSHRNPTISLPVTFFTVQKSNASSSTQHTKIST